MINQEINLYVKENCKQCINSESDNNDLCYICYTIDGKLNCLNFKRFPDNTIGIIGQDK